MLVGACGTDLRGMAERQALHLLAFALHQVTKSLAARVLSSRTRRSSSRQPHCCAAEARTATCSTLGGRVAAIRSAHRLAGLLIAANGSRTLRIAFSRLSLPF